MPSPDFEQHAEHIPGFIAFAFEIFLLFPSLVGVKPAAQTSFGLGRHAVPALAHGAVEVPLPVPLPVPMPTMPAPLAPGTKPA